MDNLRNLLQIIDENSQVKEQTKSNDPWDGMEITNKPGVTKSNDPDEFMGMDVKPMETKSNEPDYEFMGNPPGDPTYKTDPKTGNLIPDIDPTLRPNAPTGPIPGTKPQTGTTPPPPAGSAGKPPAPRPNVGTVPSRPKPPSTQDRMPSVPPAGQGVKKVTEKTLEETVDKIIKLIQVNDQLVRENKRKVNEKYMGFDKTVAAAAGKKLGEQQDVAKGLDQTNDIKQIKQMLLRNKQMLLRNDQQLLTINRQLITTIADILQSGIELTSDQEILLSQILDKLMDIRNSVQGRDVTEGIFDKLKQKFLPKPTPMPRDGDIIRVIGREVKINYVPGGYIGFTWRDKNGEEQTEEFPIGDYTGIRSPGKQLYKDIAAEISHADNPGPMDPGAQAIIDQRRAEDPQLDDIMRRREEAAAEKTDFATMPTSSTIHEQGVAEGSEQSPQEQMGQEMQSIIDRLKARMKAADRQYTVPSKPQTAEDLRMRIDNIKERIKQAEQKLDPNAQYSDDHRVYRDYYREPMDTLRYSQKELADIQAHLEKMSGSQ